MMWVWMWMACSQPSVEEATEQAPVASLPAPVTEPNGSSTWTVEAVMQPTFEAVDTDGDGQISRAEYDPYRGRGPAFQTIDLNGDGALDLSELAALMETQDPQTWEGDLKPRRPVAIEIWRGLFHGEPEVRQLSELLRFIRAEVQAMGVVDDLPTDAEIQAAAETRRFDSDAVQSLLMEMAHVRSLADESR